MILILQNYNFKPMNDIHILQVLLQHSCSVASGITEITNLYEESGVLAVCHWWWPLRSVKSASQISVFIGLGNGLLPIRHQAITWTYADFSTAKITLL